MVVWQFLKIGLKGMYPSWKTSLKVVSKQNETPDVFGQFREDGAVGGMMEEENRRCGDRRRQL